MKRVVLLGLLFLWVLNIGANAQNVEGLNLYGQYFGQTPPGNTPQLFAPGVISTRYHEHSSPVYSPNGTELFYTLAHEGGHRLMYLKLENGEWSTPTTAPFSGHFSDDKAHFSQDGERLYFSSRRPIEGLGSEENTLHPWVYREWYVDKRDGKWPATAIFNESGDRDQTFSGNRYFDQLADVDDPYSNAIYYQTLINGTYSEPIRLNDEINQGQLKYFGFVDPAEEFMIFYAFNRSGLAEGTMGLFISFRDADSSWSKAINMGDPINYDGGSTRFPRVSPDGKYLFFNWQKPRENINQQLTAVEKSLSVNGPSVDNGDIYWVSSQIIEDLRKKH